MRSIFYILAATAVVFASKNTLDCDFSERCCWKSTNREDPWTITTGINENEFRRTFLVGRSKPPPAGHYLMRFEGVEASTFESCPFCSNDGFVEVQYRHWQSPLATLELCWRLYNNQDKTEHCERVSSDKQSQLLSRPMKVDRKKNVQLFFRVQGALEEPRAVILIDKIRVRAAPCLDKHNTKSLSVAKKSKEEVDKEQKQSMEQAQTSFMGNFGGDEVTTALPTTTSRVDRLNKMAKKQVHIRQSVGYPSKQKLDDQLLSEIAELEGIEKALDPHAFDVRVPSAVLPTTNIQGEVGLPLSVPTPVLPSGAIARPVIVQPVQTPIKIQPVAAPRQAQKVLPQLPLKQAPSIAAAAVIAKSAPGNPLQDLLGEDLTNFLDPEFQFDGSDEKEYEDGDLKQEASPVTPTAPVALPASPQPQQLQQPSPSAAVPTFSQQSQQSFQPAQQPASAPPQPSVIGVQPLGVLLGNMGMAGEHPLFAHMHNHSLHHECSTPGGCLFERSMCAFRTTGQAVKPFNLTTVGISRFAETTVGANQVSVIEADTQMAEAHTIMFDGLNWQAGSRLVGCCFGAGTLQPLFCPFTSPREAGPLQWMNGRFDCMPGTTKIMFMCENYGASPATCGLDNVRLHKITDIFQHHPCQKDLLNSQ